MKLNILSNLSVDELDRPCSDADVVVLAGNIARPRAGTLSELRRLRVTAPREFPLLLSRNRR